MENMKRKFASALVEMLETSTLDKITIKALAKHCGTSRQTFYYYFNDIYNIIEWIFEQEAEKALAEYSDINTWQFGYLLLLKWIKRNHALVSNTYISIQREYIENFMNRVLSPYFVKVVAEESVGLSITMEQKKFAIRFFTLTFNAISLDWVRGGMKEDPEKIADLVGTLVKGDFRNALKNFHDANSNGKTL